MDTATYHSICKYLRRLTSRTKWEGHLYAVGGCCRDQVTGSEIKDIDIAVDLPNGGIEFAKWLRSQGKLRDKPILFEKFGTSKIILAEFPHEEIEIVQTRKEKYTKETSRCPEVCFGSLEDDCIRRDFTVNTLYYDIAADKMIDFTGRAVPDIKEGVIRTPLDPDSTFDDDPVRILRALRFASRFGWTIDPDTYAALKRNIPRLEIVSKERFHTELSKALTGNDPHGAVSALSETHAIEYANPLIAEYVRESQPEGKTPGEWQRQVESLRNLTYLPKQRRTLPLVLALLLSEMGKIRTRIKDRHGSVRYPKHELTGANMTRKMLRSMKFEPEVTDEVHFLIGAHHLTDAWGSGAEDMTDRALRSLQEKCGTEERLATLLDFLTVRSPELLPRFERIAVRSAELSEEGTAGFTAPAGLKEGTRTRRSQGRRRPDWRRRRKRKQD